MADTRFAPRAKTPAAATTRTGSATSSTTALLLTLSFIAGMVDVTSFVLFHGVFAAHITGNLVVLAADVATHRGIEATSVAAVLVFIAVTAVLTAIVDLSRKAPYQWGRAFLGLQFGLLLVVAAAAASFHAAGRTGPGIELAIVVLAVAAMAAQNALMHLTFRYAPSTAVMTGNTVAGTAALVGLGLQALRRRAAVASGRPRPVDTVDPTAWRNSWPTLLGFLVGCLVGAASSEAVSWWAWTVPAVVSGALAIAILRNGLPTALRRTV